MLITLVCPGQPVSAKNGKRGFVTSSGKVAVARSERVIAWYEEQIPKLQQQFARYDLPTITRPISVETRQFLHDDVFARVSPDGDNVMSAAWDALVKAGVIRDDKLIVAWSGSRARDAHRPRIEIIVETLSRPSF